MSKTMYFFFVLCLEMMESCWLNFHKNFSLEADMQMRRFTAEILFLTTQQMMKNKFFKAGIRCCRLPDTREGSSPVI